MSAETWDYRCDRCGTDVGSDGLHFCECGMQLCGDCQAVHEIPCLGEPPHEPA